MGVLTAMGAIGIASSGGGGGGGGASSAATLSFSVSESSLGECDSSGITITGSLTKAHSSNITITYSTSGTATNGTDFNLSSTTSTIVAGATSGSITLTPVNDTTNETSETVIISASTSGISTTEIHQQLLLYMTTYSNVIQQHTVKVVLVAKIQLKMHLHGQQLRLVVRLMLMNKWVYTKFILFHLELQV